MGSRFPEIQGVISEVGDEIEDEISLLKIEARSRWSATATKLEGLPREIPKMNSLAELRMYVADSFDAAAFSDTDRPPTRTPCPYPEPCPYP